MALHVLGSDKYRTYKFAGDLWKDLDITKVGDLVRDFYPSISRVTSKSENRAFAWLFGRIKVEGPGGVAVLYPYREYSQDVLTLRNVSFSQYPFTSVKAYTDGDSIKFLGWFDSVTDELLWSEDTIVFSKGKWPEVTGFVAKFQEDEDNLGI